MGCSHNQERQRLQIWGGAWGTSTTSRFFSFWQEYLHFLQWADAGILQSGRPIPNFSCWHNCISWLMEDAHSWRYQMHTLMNAELVCAQANIHILEHKQNERMPWQFLPPDGFAWVQEQAHSTHDPKAYVSSTGTGNSVRGDALPDTPPTKTALPSQRIGGLEGNSKGPTHSASPISSSAAQLDGTTSIGLAILTRPTFSVSHDIYLDSSIIISTRGSLADHSILHCRQARIIILPIPRWKGWGMAACKRSAPSAPSASYVHRMFLARSHHTFQPWFPIQRFCNYVDNHTT